MAVGIMDHVVYDTPVAVVDVETTGLSPGLDRVIELAVVRYEPEKKPELVLDTLVNPNRPVAATEIHGISDEDVEDAPYFSDVIGDLLRAVSGCVVSAYNVYFDIKFLNYELHSAGIDLVPPHFCLMYMRPMLGLGKRCPLGDACQCHGISVDMDHVASADAWVSAELMKIYLEEMKALEIATYRDLARLHSYKFMESFKNNVIYPSIAEKHSRCNSLKSRTVTIQSSAEDKHPIKVRDDGQKRPDTGHALGEYWEALKSAVSDLMITDEEIKQLRRRKQKLGLADEQVRMLHARLFSGVISDFIGDMRLDEKECKALNKVHSCLCQLGWAPGQPLGRHHRFPKKKSHAFAKKKMSPTSMEGKTVVITGKLDSLSRKEVKIAIEHTGGRTASSVSRNTDIVVVGKSAGAKADKATEYGIEQIDEEELLRRLWSK